jgi:hypothetical protein
MRFIFSHISNSASFAILLTTLAFAPVVAWSADSAEEKLIVPGKNIGKTHLGANGLAYLKDLPKPDASDPGMSQNRLIWISGKAPEVNTLFIHTVANGVIDAKPAEGMTIDEIRITSTAFHTPEGIKCGSTLAEIRKVFPDLKPVEDSAGTVLQDAAHGAAFEFTGPPTDDSPCIAITVFAPDAAHITSRDQVARLLKDHP